MSLDLSSMARRTWRRQTEAASEGAEFAVFTDTVGPRVVDETLISEMGTTKIRYFLGESGSFVVVQTSYRYDSPIDQEGRMPTDSVRLEASFCRGKLVGGNADSLLAAHLQASLDTILADTLSTRAR